MKKQFLNNYLTLQNAIFPLGEISFELIMDGV